MTSTLPADDDPPALVASSEVTALATHHADPHADPSPNCRNCGALAPGRFCPACAQTTTLHPPTVREFVHEFINHTVAFDGSLWRTLLALLARPGLLTVEYFAGRRQRYIPPLRLYLTFSLVFFAISGSSDGDLSFGNQAVRFSTNPQPADRVVIGPRKPTEFKTGFAMIDNLGARLDKMPAVEREAKLHEGMRRNLPYALILLVPVLALYLKIAYWGRRRLYGEHLVVAFHAQTVAFIYALVSAIPLGETYGAIVFLAFLVQAGLALRRVYGGRKRWTVVREFVLFVTYGLTVSIALGALAVGSVLIALPPA